MPHTGSHWWKLEGRGQNLLDFWNTNRYWPIRRTSSMRSKNVSGTVSLTLDSTNEGSVEIIGISWVPLIVILAAFMCASSDSKFTHSFQFLRELFSTNPFLKFVAVRYRERVNIVNALERAAERWTPMRKGKP